MSGMALAQDAGFYVSGSIGQSEIDIDTGPFTAAGVTGVSADETDIAWKFNVGYQFTRHWGVEVGYVSFGDFSVTGAAGTVASVDAKAWTLAGVGTLPLGNSNFSLFGKLGAYLGHSRGNATIGAAPVRVSDRRVDIFGGIGVRYDFNRNFGVQLEAERYNGDDPIQKLQDTNLFTVGLRYKF